MLTCDRIRCIAIVLSSSNVGCDIDYTWVDWRSKFSALKAASSSNCLATS